MSLIVGSRSSGSSGPRPNTSSSSSPKSASRSPRLSGVPFLGEQLAEQRADLALGARAIGLRQRLEVQAVEQLAVHARLQLEVLLARRLGTQAGRRERRRGRDTVHRWLPDGREALEAAAACASRRLRRRRRGAGLENLPREVIELRRDVGVAGQRQRHAGVERGRHGLVVARERVVNRVAERALDLLRRNRIRLRPRG